MSRPHEGASLLLVSGGPDSIYLFHHFLKRRDLLGGFAVLHVNHGLRGAESDGDEEFVRAVCAKHGVACFTRRLDPAVLTAGNVQNLARRARLKACFELQRDEGFRAAMTAHHADDAIETLVMHAGRGAGLSGLCGIRLRARLKNPLLPGASLELKRLILHLTKREILEFLSVQGIPFRTDSSNATDKYLRNRVRKGLEAGSAEWSRILALARSLQRCDDYFRARVAHSLKLYRHFVPASVWDSWPEEIRFRFFARKMRGNGYFKQVERRHFDAACAQQTRLVLDGAHFFRDEAGCYFYSLRSLAEFKRPRAVLNPGRHAFGMVDRRFRVDMAGTILFAGEFGTLPLKSTFVRWRQHEISLKDWCHENKVPLWQRRFLPVLKVAGEESVRPLSFD